MYTESCSSIIQIKTFIPELGIFYLPRVELCLFRHVRLLVCKYINKVTPFEKYKSEILHTSFFLQKAVIEIATLLSGKIVYLTRDLRLTRQELLYKTTLQSPNSSDRTTITYSCHINWPIKI